MPEDDFKYGNVRYGIKNACYAAVNADGSYDFVGVVGEVPFSLSDDDGSSQPFYQELKEGYSGSMTFRIPWWQLNNWTEVLSLRAPYLVANLRRGGKSHRGKARPLYR